MNTKQMTKGREHEQPLWTYAKEDGSWIIRQRGIEIGMAYSEASAESLVATHNAAVAAAIEAAKFQ